MVLTSAIHRLAMALSIVSCLSACDEGRKVTAQGAHDWLPSAFPRLQRVIVLLRICQPGRPSGYNTIWVKDGDGGEERAHCRSGSDTALRDIQAALRDNGVLGVAYSPSGDPRKPVDYASFILFREGLATSGSSTSVEYYATPQPCLTKTEGDKAFHVVREPIATAPCRWFWEHDEN